MKGRRSTPTTLKIVRGNPGRRPLNTDKPTSKLLKRMPPTPGWRRVNLACSEVPMHIAPDLTAAQCRAYRIADNPGEEVRWGDKLLKPEVIGVSELAELTALDPKEMKRLGLAENAARDAVPSPPARPVARFGQIWQLGKQLLCGDSTRPESVSRLMGGERGKLFASDLTYAVGCAGASHLHTRANRAKANRDKDRSKVFHEARQTTFENVAEQLGRRCYSIELEPRFVNVAIARWETLTGQQVAMADLVEIDGEETKALG
jgi:hypothetical protein